MIDLSNQQDVYTAIKSNDSKDLWTLAAQIAQSARKLSTTQKALNQANSSDVSEVTESMLRTRTKEVLWQKLDSGEITAAEFAQFKDVFGLASAENDLQIEVVSYSELCADCPISREPVPIERNPQQ